MNQEEFIKAIKIGVHDATINGIKSSLTRPPGRKPHAKDKELSLWFNNLSERDKSQTMEIVRHTVHASIFDMLCVLDGVIAIESSPEKGELLLLFRKNGKETHLNNPHDEMLHDIYQSQVQAEIYGKE